MEIAKKEPFEQGRRNSGKVLVEYDRKGVVIKTLPSGACFIKVLADRSQSTFLKRIDESNIEA